MLQNSFNNLLNQMTDNVEFIDSSVGNNIEPGSFYIFYVNMKNLKRLYYILDKKCYRLLKSTLESEDREFIGHFIGLLKINDTCYLYFDSYMINEVIIHFLDSLDNLNVALNDPKTDYNVIVVKKI